MCSSSSIRPSSPSVISYFSASRPSCKHSGPIARLLLHTALRQERKQSATAALRRCCSLTIKARSYLQRAACVKQKCLLIVRNRCAAAPSLAPLRQGSVTQTCPPIVRNRCAASCHCCASIRETRDFLRRAPCVKHTCLLIVRNRCAAARAFAPLRLASSVTSAPADRRASTAARSLACCCIPRFVRKGSKVRRLRCAVAAR